MNAFILTMLAWGALSVILIVYVIYRLLTDPKKNTDSSSHRAHPFRSNPGDPMFPARGDTLAWVAYVFLCIGAGCFLVMIGIMIFNYNSDPPAWLINIFGVFFFMGSLLQVISSLNKARGE